MRNRSNAFTLVELLVVVAIIALLLSILLPSLASAREQAKQLVCATKLKEIGTGTRFYGNDNDDWLPGAPGTTGYNLLMNTTGSTRRVDIPGGPVQTWDWMAPLAKNIIKMNVDKLPDNRYQRWVTLVESAPFRCPSNNDYVPQWDSERNLLGPFPPDWPRLQLRVSFGTTRDFMYFPNVPELGSNQPWETQTRYERTEVILPPEYTPRLSVIENPSGKVFLHEGPNFIQKEPAEPTCDFDISYKAGFGGAFSAAGPPFGWGRGFVFDISHGSGSYRDRLSYRHGPMGEPAMDILFFDGHAESISKENAIKTIELWWPAGTDIELQEFTDAGGTSYKRTTHFIMQNRPPSPRGSAYRRIN